VPFGVHLLLLASSKTASKQHPPSHKGGIRTKISLRQRTSQLCWIGEPLASAGSACLKIHQTLFKLCWCIILFVIPHHAHAFKSTSSSAHPSCQSSKDTR
jgi:hypothetical protein